MHIGIIAAKATLSEFRAAFSDTWPELQITATQNRFGSVDDIWTWTKANERFVSARNWTKEDPGSVVYIFYQDGPWAVLMDFSYVRAGDQKALQQLSTRFGIVLSFIVESAGGCAYFWNFEAGQLRRMIQNLSGELTSSGGTLPEEEGIDVESYYMEETGQLMRAFGLSSPENLPVVSTTVGIATIDHTDYLQRARSTGCPKAGGMKSPSRSDKPWWMVW